jgi:condensin complex subunit 2
MQGQEDDDEEQEGGSDVEGAQRARQRKVRASIRSVRAITQRVQAGRKAETLVDSFDKIAAKKLDLEVSVDPLFKKTAADFDEGGAGGILMNHLGLDSSMRVIFDAGDARLEDAGVEEAEDEDDGMVDVAQLQAAFLPDLDLIEEMVICPSLASFKFSSDPNVLDLGLFRANLGGSVTSRAHEADPLGDSTVATPTGEAGGDFFTSGAGDEQDFEDFGGGGGDGDDFDDAGDGGADFFADEPEALDAQRPPNEREIVMAFAKDGDGQMFDYFDAALAKNWAGPQHWKMHRTIRRVGTLLGFAITQSR